MNERATSRWRPLIWVVPAAIVLVAVAVVAARWVLHADWAAGFFRAHSGTGSRPTDSPIGIPVWLDVTHLLNAVLLVFIVRSGLAIRSKSRPPAFWTRDAAKLPRVQRALGLRGAPTRLSIHVWWHLVIDTLWTVNGVVALVLMFTTGQWMRLVPTSWDVVPNAVSALVRYLAFEWPVPNAWVQYNALQQLSYFVTVFIAAPLAVATGVRLSPGWPAGWRINRVVTDRLVRRVHFAVFVYLVVFTIFHVALVLATGAIENLNIMYAARDDAGALGAWIFADSVVVTAALWVLATPERQAWLGERVGSVRRMPPPRSHAADDPEAQG